MLMLKLMQAVELMTTKMKKMKKMVVTLHFEKIIVSIVGAVENGGIVGSSLIQSTSTIEIFLLLRNSNLR